jgi:intracellular sulfur oxidation DsrE/DsrF family protein
VVFQVSDADPKKWTLTLNNVKNLQEALGANNVSVEIVAYGPGIGMLKADSEIGNRVLEALQAQVAVMACENTMRGQHLTHADMLGKIGYVPSGVAELVKRQAEGYAYIRA